jgi:hypothetical protein
MIRIHRLKKRKWGGGIRPILDIKRMPPDPSLDPINPGKNFSWSRIGPTVLSFGFRRTNTAMPT